MDIEFAIDGHNYRMRKMNAITQLHVSRRIAPFVSKLVPVFIQLHRANMAMNADNMGAMAEAAQPLAEAFAQMPDADAEYVINSCMTTVMREQPEHKTWAAVWNTDAKSAMFPDVELPQILQMTVRVLRENLGNFISGLLSNVPEAPAAQQEQKA